MKNCFKGLEPVYIVGYLLFMASKFGVCTDVVCIGVVCKDVVCIGVVCKDVVCIGIVCKDVVCIFA